MTIVDEKIKELEEIRNGEELSSKRSLLNKQVLNEMCDGVLYSPLAGNYFSREVSKCLSSSCFSRFSVAQLEDEVIYISDFGDEICISNEKGMKSITYRSEEDQKSIKLYRSEDHAFVKTEDYSKEDKAIKSGMIRIYNLTRTPVFEREKKYTIAEGKDKKIVLLEKYGYKNHKLTRGIYSTITTDDSTVETKYERIVDKSLYDIVDGELYVRKEDESLVFENNSDVIKRLLKM